MKRIWILGLLLSGCGLLAEFDRVQVEAPLPKGANEVRWVLKEAEGGAVLGEGEATAGGRARWSVPAYNAQTVLEVFALSRGFPIAFGEAALDAKSAGRKVVVFPARGRVRMELRVDGFEEGDLLYVYLPRGLEEVELESAPLPREWARGWAAVYGTASPEEPFEVLLAPKYRFALKRGDAVCEKEEVYPLTYTEIQMVEEALRRGEALPVLRDLSFECEE